MLKTMRTLAPLTLTASLFIACSARVAPPTMAQACDDYAQAWRWRQVNCYDVPNFPDQASFSARAATACTLYDSAPGSRVAPSDVETCAARASANCDAFTCDPAPAGARADGEPCLTGVQCEGLWCRGTGVLTSSGSYASHAAQCGTCAHALPAGARCDVATDACAGDFTCQSGTCQPKGGMGSPCAHANDCAFPAFCRSNGTCGELLFTGDPCGTSADCTTESACDTTTKVCMPATYGAPGAACDHNVLRCETGVCSSPQVGMRGVCPPVLADGSACDPSDSSVVCADYALCFRGMCQIPDPATCR